MRRGLNDLLGRGKNDTKNELLDTFFGGLTPENL